MRIFALETDNRKLEQSCLCDGEKLLLALRFHGFLFFAKALGSIVLTAVLIALAGGALYLGAPVGPTIGAAASAWLIFVFFRLLKAFIDWRFDLIILTSEKLVAIDQTSIFHANTRQMNLENIASVSAETQFMNIFPFGKLNFDLKEGTGRSLTLAYIPHADEAASIISDAVINFQRRKAAGAQNLVSPAAAKTTSPAA